MSFCRFIFNLFIVYFILPGAVFSQPARERVQVIVSPDKKDWEAQLGETTTFTVTVYRNQQLQQDLSIHYAMGTEKYEAERGIVNLSSTEGVRLRGTLNEPGHLRCIASVTVDGKMYRGMATVAYEREKIKPVTTKPVDFETFWNEQLENARQVPLDAKVTLLPDRCTSTQNVYQVSFQNDRRGSRIYGILFAPKRAGKYPAVLHIPGAGIRAHAGTNLGDSILTLAIGVHGIPVDLKSEVYQALSNAALAQHRCMNLSDRENYYYKRIVTGCMRAIDFIHTLDAFDGERVGVMGGSQGGALSLMVAALEPRISFAAVFHPAFCDLLAGNSDRATCYPVNGMGRMLTVEEQQSIAYYDIVNFATMIRVPTWFSWGFNDETCSPTAMQAAYNLIKADKQLHISPDVGHWFYPDDLEQRHRWVKEKSHRSL